MFPSQFRKTLGVALIDSPGQDRGGRPRVVLDACVSGPPILDGGPAASFSWLVWRERGSKVEDPEWRKIPILYQKAASAPRNSSSWALHADRARGGRRRDGGGDRRFGEARDREAGAGARSGGGHRGE